jgi:hypothetical protein
MRTAEKEGFAMRQMTVIAAILAAGATWVHTGFAQSAPAPITAQQWHGGGGWKTSGKAAVAGQQWHVDALRATDNSLSGRVTLAKSEGDVASVRTLPFRLPAGGEEGHRGTYPDSVPARSCRAI